MTTLRNRRALSMRRRSGLQTDDYQTAMGRTPRHAQGWADLTPQRASQVDPDWIVGAVMVAITVGLALSGASSLIWSVLGWIQ